MSAFTQVPEVVVGYTTESGNSAGVYGVFDPGSRLRFATNNNGAVALDRVRVARSVGHAFELSRAINELPKTGPKASRARHEFDARWAEPRIERSQDWKRVAAAAGK